MFVARLVRHPAGRRREGDPSPRPGMVRRALLVTFALAIGTIGFSPTAFGATELVTPAQRAEQVRYAWETDEKTYSGFMDRKYNDFAPAGCVDLKSARGKDHAVRGLPCRKPVPYDYFDWSTDGCSVPGLKAAYTSVFRAACEQHDFAYRNLGKGLKLDRSISSRKRIDKKLYIEARRTCVDRFSGWRVVGRPSCLDAAEVMYSFFRLPSSTPPKGPENWDKPCPEGVCIPVEVSNRAPQVASPPVAPVAPTPAPSTPSTPAIPAVGSFPYYQVTGTCRAGCGLWMFSSPDWHSATTRKLADGTTLEIVCQTQGVTLSEAGYTSAIWNKTAQGDWASDLYLNTPVYGGFSPPIPRCDTAPPAAATYPYTITGTCRAGCGLWMFSSPDWHSPTTRKLGDGTVLQIVCQARGVVLSEAGYTSAIWDKTAEGDWASDLYLNTPVYADFSPGIPRC